MGNPQLPESNPTPSIEGTISAEYPLELHFKFFALSPKIRMTDVSGKEILYIHQKLFKLKEDVRIYRDSSKQQELFRINADRILDFSAQYHFTRSWDNQPLGSVARKGWNSIWKATYQCFDHNKQQTHIIVETNPWAKIMDSFISQIPLIGILSSFMFHPSYSIYQGTKRDELGFEVLSLTKKASFFELKFQIDRIDFNLTPETEQRLLLSLLMLVLLERGRG